jgi:hypothetical protein
MRDGIKKSLKKSCLSLAWKIKAVKRRFELKALNKRFKEVEESRDKWKQKANDRQAEIQKLDNELSKLKKDYENLSKKKSVETGKPPKRYKYGINVIQALVGCKLLSSGGFRALSKIFRIISLSLSLVIEIPCRNTIRSWVQKIGYYELTRPKEVSDDWIIILDLSMQLGQDKILLIYGIRRKNLNFDRPLKMF